ncbi:MAG TPA: serine hydrolase domain-containing protein [Phycisphaerales bacterium]|nr:serine hydrolase domain-containing protein [Phycisphaerales bacterium]
MSADSANPAKAAGPQPTPLARRVANLIARTHPRFARARFTEAIRRTTPELLERHRVPGFQCAFMIAEAAPRTMCFGVADVQTREPMTDGTRFRIGSLAKPVAAVVFLTLVRDRVLDLDEPLAEIRPFFEGCPPDARARAARLTARLLLAHRSGLASVHPPRIEASAFADADREAWLNAANLRFEDDLGPESGYSSVNYALLEAVAVKRTGLGFPALARRRLFDVVGVPCGHEGAVPPGGAVSADHDEQGRSIVVHPSASAASSGLVASAPDLCRLMHAAFFTDAVLPPALRDVLRTPQPPGRPDASFTAGLHLYRDTDARSLGHGGQRAGHRSILVVVPRARAVLCVATNGENGSPVTRPLTGFFRAITIGD